MSDRPDWLVCALTGVYVDEIAERKTWCGRDAEQGEFCFVDAGHAALNASSEGRLVLCPQCRDAIINVLREHGSERPPERNEPQ